jgi:hypothetical protein
MNAPAIPIAVSISGVIRAGIRAHSQLRSLRSELASRFCWIRSIGLEGVLFTPDNILSFQMSGLHARNRLHGEDAAAWPEAGLSSYSRQMSTIFRGTV